MPKQKHILIVEDDPNEVELILTSSADDLANEVISFREGNEALDYLNCRGKFARRTDGNPAVVLLDLKLPRISGFEILKQIKTDENLKVVPVVILTSSREDQDIAEAYRLGANGYAVKPIDFHEFVNVVKQIGTFWAIINEQPPSSVR